MAYLGNSPNRDVILRLEARKSFALSLWIVDSNQRPLDITDAELRIIAKKPPFGPDDSNNLITNSSADLTNGTEGLARFALQASDLDWTPGEYPYAIVMIIDGYSAVIASGTIALQTNTEFASVGSTYSGANPPSALQVTLEGPRTIEVTTGSTLAPGTQSFTDADKQKLDGIEDGAQVNDEERLVPSGGATNAVLAKFSNDDFNTHWISVQSLPGGPLTAEGVAAGYTPTANGSDGWGWEPSVTNADDIEDGVVKVMMTTDERTKLGGLTNDYTELDNLPTLGTAAAADSDDFAPATGIDASAVTTGTFNKNRIPKVTDLNGATSGTAPPSGGADGDLYFQYT